MVHKGNAEFVVRGVGWLGAGAEGLSPEDRTRRVVADLERVVVPRERRLAGPAVGRRDGVASAAGRGAGRWRRTATKSAAAWS